MPPPYMPGIFGVTVSGQRFTVPVTGYKPGDMVEVSEWGLVPNNGHTPNSNTGVLCEVLGTRPGFVLVSPPSQYRSNPSTLYISYSVQESPRAWEVLTTDVIGLAPAPSSTITTPPTCTGAACVKCKEWNAYQSEAFTCFRCRSNGGMP